MNYYNFYSQNDFDALAIKNLIKQNLNLDVDVEVERQNKDSLTFITVQSIVELTEQNLNDIASLLKVSR